MQTFGGKVSSFFGRFHVTKNYLCCRRFNQPSATKEIAMLLIS